MRDSKGVLITLEGGEGCGKSTQSRLLCSHLKKKGLKVFLTREPGGTKAGDAIRRVLLDKRTGRLSGISETLLYMAARAALVEEVVLPKLREGHIVLCDRWLDATVAYQGFGEGVDLDWIRSVGEKVTRGMRPKLTVYLDLPVETGLRRAKDHKAADRMELKKISFHEKVRKGYLAIARREPARVKRLQLNAGDSIENVHARIKELVDRVL